MKKTYYPQDIVTNITNKKLKVLFKDIGKNVFLKDSSYVTNDISGPQTPAFLAELVDVIKQFFTVIDVADPLLVLLPNYYVSTKDKISRVKKETHPFYGLFNIKISNVYTEDSKYKNSFSVTINEDVLKSFLTEFVFYLNSTVNIDSKTNLYKYWFIIAVNQYLSDVSTSSALAHKYYQITKHTTKNLAYLKNDNLFYNFDPEYNFYIKKYENLFSASVNPEGMMPNYYATDMYLNSDEKERIKNFVSLDGRIDVTEQTILSNEYFNDYSDVVSSITDPEEKKNIYKISNYVLDSFYSNSENIQLSSENFPYSGKITFSNYEQDSLSSIIDEKNLDTLVVNNSHYLFANKALNTNPAATATSLPNVPVITENFFISDEIIIKKPSESGEYTDYDGKTYDLLTDMTMGTEYVDNTLPENVFQFNTNDPKNTGFIVYPQSDVCFYTKDNLQYLNKLSKPLAVFPYLILKNKMDEICNSKMDYNNVVKNQSLDVYPLCFQVEKLTNNKINNIISVARNSKNSQLSVNDTQLKYEKNYNYKVYSLNFVNTFGYNYTNLAYNVSSNSATGVVEMYEQCKIYKNVIIDEQFEIFDDPPTPIDVNIVPFVGIPNRLLFLFNTQSTTLLDIPIPIQQKEVEYFNRVRKKQRLNSKKVMFETVEDLTAVQVFRTTTPPKSYRDFSSNLYRIVSLSKQTSNSFVENLEQNKKYYYTFRSIDIHNNISNPTSIFEVEIKNNDGAIYSIIKPYELKPEQDYTYNKSLKKYISINPSVLFTELQKQDDGTIKIGSETGLWNQKFKMRVTSKKSGKSFDINLTFNQVMKNLLDNSNDLNSDVVVTSEEE
jgi:hypothetical protein